MVQVEKSFNSHHSDWFFTFKIGGKFSVFIKVGFFLVCWCCIPLPCLALKNYKVGMTLEEITLMLLKSKKIVSKINGGIVQEPSSACSLYWTQVASMTWYSWQPSLASVPVYTKCDYSLSSVTIWFLQGSMPAVLLPITCFCS